MTTAQVGAAAEIRAEMIRQLDLMLADFHQHWRAQGKTLPEIDAAIASERPRLIAEIDQRLVGEALASLARQADAGVSH